MSDSGLAAYPKLICDEANRFSIELLEIGDEARRSGGALWAPASVGRALFGQLSQVFRSCSVVITLEGLVQEVVQICPKASIFPMDLSVAHSADREMTFLLPSSCDFGEGRDLGVYLLIDSLPYWRKIKQICDTALHQGSRVKLAFRHQTWAGFALGYHTWIHSLLLTFFPCEEYDASLKLLLEPGETDWAGENALVDVSAWVLVPTVPRDSCIGLIVTLLRHRALRAEPGESSRVCA